MFILPKKAVVIDLETTNKCKPPIYITQIGAVAIKTTLEAEEFRDWGVQPENLDSYDAFCEAFTRVPSTELLKYEFFSDIWRQVADFCDWHNRLLVVWGAAFDIAVLHGEFNRLNLEYPLSPHVFDVKSAAIFYFSFMGMKPARGRWTLKDVAKRLEIDVDEDRLHNALYDAGLTLSVLRRLAKLMEADYDRTRREADGTCSPG